MPIGFKKVLRKENGIFSRAFKLFSKISRRHCSGERGHSHGGKTVGCPAAGSSKVTDLLQGNNNNNNNNNNSAVLGLTHFLHTALQPTPRSIFSSTVTCDTH